MCRSTPDRSAFSGYDQYSASHSLTMGFPSNGPYNSHEMVISMAYRKAKYAICPIPSAGKPCQTWRQVDETGLYDPGHGWVLVEGRQKRDLSRRQSTVRKGAQAPPLREVTDHDGASRAELRGPDRIAAAPVWQMSHPDLPFGLRQASTPRCGRRSAADHGVVDGYPCGTA